MSYVYLWMPIGWIGLDMTIILYVYMALGRVYFKPRGVKKNSVPYMTELYLPVLLFKVELFTLM